MSVNIIKQLERLKAIVCDKEMALPADKISEALKSIQIISREISGGTEKLVKSKGSSKKKSSKRKRLGIRFFENIQPLFQFMLSSNIYAPFKLSSFYAKVEDFLTEVPDSEFKKDTGVRFLSELLNVLFCVRSYYGHPSFQKLKAELDSCIKDIIKNMGRRECVVIPNTPKSLEISHDSFNFIYGCSTKPKGQVLYVINASVKSGEKLISPGKAILSCGYSSQIYDFLKNVTYVLLLNRSILYSEYWNNQLKWLEEYCQKIAENRDHEKKDSYKALRDAINLLIGLEGDSTVRKFIEKGEHLIEKYGIQPIEANVGDRYYSVKHSKDKYDIKEVIMPEKEGLIIKQSQIGFMDTDGNILQKGLLCVGVLPPAEENPAKKN